MKQIIMKQIILMRAIGCFFLAFFGFSHVNAGEVSLLPGSYRIILDNEPVRMVSENIDVPHFLDIFWQELASVDLTSCPQNFPRNFFLKDTLVFLKNFSTKLTQIEFDQNTIDVLEGDYSPKILSKEFTVIYNQGTCSITLNRKVQIDNIKNDPILNIIR